MNNCHDKRRSIVEKKPDGVHATVLCQCGRFVAEQVFVDEPGKPAAHEAAMKWAAWARVRHLPSRKT